MIVIIDKDEWYPVYYTKFNCSNYTIRIYR